MPQPDAVTKAYSHCLQGDIRPAIRVLRRGRSCLSPSGVRLLSGLERRFVEKKNNPRLATQDPLIREIVGAYRLHYTEVLTGFGPSSRAESALKNRLKQVLQKYGVKTNGEVASALEKEIKKRNLYCLLGTMTPHHCILVWSQQKMKTYKVNLPGGSRRCKVRFLDGFLDLGWMHYATLGRYYSGGWALVDEITCVRKAYNLNSEKFRISLLAHESQHQADNEAFPKLEGADLEYRAKLVQLGLTSKPNKMAESFRHMAAPNDDSVHALSSYVLLQDLFRVFSGQRKDPRKSAWLPVSAPKLREIAHEILDLHTQSMQKYGAETVKNLIGIDRWESCRP